VAAKPGPTRFTRLGVKDTGKIAVPELGEGGGLDLPGHGELDLDFSLDREPSKEELKRHEQENRRKLTSVPQRFHFYLGDDVEQKDAYVRLTGAEPTATGFIARVDPTLREVRQLVRLTVQPPEDGVCEIAVWVRHETGTPKLWWRLNKPFFFELRRQLLGWRKVSPERMREYIERVDDVAGAVSVAGR